MGDGSIQFLHGALPRLGQQVRVPHGHLDGGVPNQFLNDLEGNASHREVAAVGVPQVVPADAALRAADARYPQRSQEWVLEIGPVRWTVGLCCQLTGRDGLNRSLQVTWACYDAQAFSLSPMMRS